MSIEGITEGLPDGDLRIEFEHVMGGWCCYVCLFPVHGPIVPSTRNKLYARSEPCPTREEAIAQLPSVLDNIREKGEDE